MNAKVCLALQNVFGIEVYCLSADVNFAYLHSFDLNMD